MTGVLNTVLTDHREKVVLAGYCVIMLVLTPSLATLFGSAYQDGHLSRALIDLHRLVDIIDLQGVSVFVLGIFLGLLILMTIDAKKRVQGILLWIGVGIAMVGLQSMGLFIPNIEFTDTTNIGWLGFGLLLGFVLGGGRKLTQTRVAEAFEFRRASFGIYLMVLFLILVAMFEYHVTYPEFVEVSADGLVVYSIENPDIGVENDGLIRNVVVSGIFIFTIRRFIQYDSEEDFFVLGPKGSGKSLFLTGAYLAAANRNPTDEAITEAPLQPSQDLIKLVEKVDQNTSGWVVDSTQPGEIKDLRFQYVHGSAFPKNVKIESIDYAGEYLTELPNVLSGAIPEDEADNTLLRLVQGIEEADTLILLLDMERFDAGEPLEISEYFSVLQAVDNTDVFLVATKADLFTEDFFDEQGIEAHLAYDEYKTYMSGKLGQSEQVRELMRQASNAEIHPVYYQTTVEETELDEEKRVPMRDGSGSVMTIGFEQLLEELGR